MDYGDLRGDGAFDSLDFNLRYDLIRKQACFSKLTEKEVEVLASLLIEKKIPAGTTIVQQGDEVDSVYLIVSGTADVQLVSYKDQKPHYESVATLKENQSIGLSETGFYSLSGRRTATVIALTDMIVLRLSVAAFNGFALSYPHVNEVMRFNKPSMSDFK